MPGFVKKTLIKWTTIAVLGVSAYFLGYFWGVQKLGEDPVRNTASEKSAPASQEAADFSHLK